MLSSALRSYDQKGSLFVADRLPLPIKYKQLKMRSYAGSRTLLVPLWDIILLTI